MLYSLFLQVNCYCWLVNVWSVPLKRQPVVFPYAMDPVAVSPVLEINLVLHEGGHCYYWIYY